MGASRIRLIAGLVAVALVLGVFTLSPVAAHFTTNTKHLGNHAWKQVIKKKVFTKKQANRRFAHKKLEAVHRVGTPGEPAFQNGFANLGGGFETAGFYRDGFGIVHVVGDMTAPGNGVAFTLPPAYRPATNHRYAVQGNGDGNTATIRIEPGGEIRFFSIGGATSVTLNGVTFRPASAGGTTAASPSGGGGGSSDSTG